MRGDKSGFEALARAASGFPTALATPYPRWVLFLSAGEPSQRAQVVCASADTFDEAWNKARAALPDVEPQWLRLDIVEWIEQLSLSALEQKLSRTKRSYFRFGLSFDSDFTHALLEQEISGNAILYQSSTPLAALNPENLARYSKQRFNQALKFPERQQDPIWRFTTRAWFFDSGTVYPINSIGRESGYRTLKDWPEQHLPSALQDASDYLAKQVKENGRYHYGWFPCFDKPIPAYNTLRHASSTYALLEAWELTQSPTQFAAIQRALDYLTTVLIHSRPLPNGVMADFLVDEGNEVKLGGNAVAILALAKYGELTGDTRYISQMIRLARTLRYMQNPKSGMFVHVINYPDLSLKAVSRIIYYDGEAAFALIRLYGVTGQAEWLEMVERALDNFIAREHWRAHDHWLSYCVNELVAYRPLEKYFRFGLDNVRGHLDFVLERVTTYPTLLELMMAASQMLVRLKASPHRHLLDDFDSDKFEQALAHRARYLLNGFFWPELAMYFANPRRIVGSFFIRHHVWRVRIDDVEHYLSGYVAWLKHYRRTQRQPMALKVAAGPQVMFLGENLREVGNGIEIAMLRRARLFAEYLSLPVTLMFSAWNPQLGATEAALRAKGQLPKHCRVQTVYHALLAMRDSGELRPLACGLARALPQPAPLTRRQIFSDTSTKTLIREEFVDAFGQLLLCKYYVQSSPGVRLSHIAWRDEKGDEQRLTSDEALNSWLLGATLAPRSEWHFIVDKNAPWRQFVMRPEQRPPHSTLTAVLHSTHQREDGRLKYTYAHLLNAPESYDQLLTLTREQQDELVAQGFPAAKLQVIPHSAVIPAQDSPKAAGQQVLYMARYAPEKQHALLIRVFAQVVAQLPRARLVCYGNGPLRAEIEAQVSRSGLNEWIAINGYCEDIAALQRASQCAVLCSREEGFGMFALESLSYGTPLVSFAVKYGPRDLLADGESGVLVALGDEAGLAAALVMLLQSPERQRAMSRAARQTALRYAPGRIAALWRAWWEQIKLKEHSREAAELAEGTTGATPGNT